VKPYKNNTENNTSGLRYAALMSALIVSALILSTRLAYLFLSDADRFPLVTVKVAANYHHVTHAELEGVLAKYASSSFFSLPVRQLQNELNQLTWVDSASVERVWPDTLKIKLIEKKPVAIWGTSLLTEDGNLFKPNKLPQDLNIPHVDGPIEQFQEVLQVYEKLSKILSSYGLSVSRLRLRDNQSWVLSLANGAKIYLGKKELESRLLRFCKAYPAVFAEKEEQLASVDLRYPRGMAVQWKQQTRR